MKISVSVRPCTEDDPQHNGACSTMRIPGVSRQPRYTGQWQKVVRFFHPDRRTLEMTYAFYRSAISAVTSGCIKEGYTHREIVWAPV